MMTLAGIYQQMIREASRHGRSTAQLSGGVKLTLTSVEGISTIAVWRRHKKLSDTEIITFSKHFDVPAGARRLPEAGQRERVIRAEREAADGTMDEGSVTWYGIAWQWGGGE